MTTSDHTKGASSPRHPEQGLAATTAANREDQALNLAPSPAPVSTRSHPYWDATRACNAVWRQQRALGYREGLDTPPPVLVDARRVRDAEWRDYLAAGGK